MNQEYCSIARLRDTREATLCIRQYLKKQTNKQGNKQNKANLKNSKGELGRSGGYIAYKMEVL